MNHTPVKVVAVTAGVTTTISDKHRAIIISNSGGATTAVVTLVFMDKNGQNTGDFVIRIVGNSGPFYIPCRITSVSCTGSNITVALLV